MFNPFKRPCLKPSRITLVDSVIPYWQDIYGSQILGTRYRGKWVGGVFCKVQIDDIFGML